MITQRQVHPPTSPQFVGGVMIAQPVVHALIVVYALASEETEDTKAQKNSYPQK